MNDYEPLQKDKFWVSDDSIMISMPRTGLANQNKHRKPMRHIPSYKPIGNRDAEEVYYHGEDNLIIFDCYIDQ
ncbi:unnamed protein product [Brugia pahangi]|nr:unnamed protein product [Brugia pahangi]